MVVAIVVSSERLNRCRGRVLQLLLQVTKIRGAVLFASYTIDVGSWQDRVSSMWTRWRGMEEHTNGRLRIKMTHTVAWKAVWHTGNISFSLCGLRVIYAMRLLQKASCCSLAEAKASNLRVIACRSFPFAPPKPIRINTAFRP